MKWVASTFYCVPLTQSPPRHRTLSLFPWIAVKLHPSSNVCYWLLSHPCSFLFLTICNRFFVSAENNFRLCHSLFRFSVLNSKGTNSTLFYSFIHTKMLKLNLSVTHISQLWLWPPALLMLWCCEVKTGLIKYTYISTKFI